MAAKDKGSKKRWISIVAPAMFNNQLLGDIYLANPEDAIGRNVTVSLSSIMAESHRQNVNVGFIIEKKDGNNLSTVLKKYYIIPSALRKMVRRNKSKIDNSFVVKLKDGTVVRLKLVLVTRSKVSGSLGTAVFHFTKSWVVKETGDMTFDQLVQQVFTKRFQRSLQQATKKLCPLQVCEIRYLEKLTGERAERANIVRLAAKKVETSTAPEKAEA